MTTLFYSHAAFAAHETPDGHPERSARHAAVENALSTEEFAALRRMAPPRAAAEAIARAHPGAYFDAVSEAAPLEGSAQLDPDTFMGPNSLEAALRAAGGACDAVERIMRGEARNAFVAARPPGHHATPQRPMGFCLFNSAAIAALHARALGAARIAVVDFDVHHGNGTEAVFWHDDAGFFASSHEWPQYPGTGRRSDRGAYGNIVNAPLETGSGGVDFRRAWGEEILPALDAFRPDFIVVSAGFDAHIRDPLGGLRLTEDDFAWATAEIAGVAATACAGRIVSLLEGGYDLEGLGGSAAAHVRALLAA